MNQISPKVLLNSKWTKINITNKEKHFIVTKVKFDDEQRVVKCLIEAVFSGNEYDIHWRDLKDSQEWKVGWK
ncbi:TIGR02450 family Trp-rich protein [Paraglaciecola sp.]|uniref:TIGR02450 family Trp-rich protein n=1 Tax=Paraglaciecola sp. TaxID=1920173 RepID=UPI003EF92BFC